MQYLRLYDLNNQYPSIGNYITITPGKVNFYGLYPETNYLTLEQENLDKIKFIEGTTFRFIFKIKKAQSDKEGDLYTSEKYYKDLQNCIKESNPYFTNKSFTKPFIVEFFYEDLVTLFESFKPKEYSSGVEVIFNNFINKDKTINFIKLIKYLDWVVKAPALSEIETNGVIKPEDLITYREFEIDQEKAYFYPNSLQTPPSSGGSGTGSTGGNSAQAQQEEKERKNAETNAKIREVESDIAICGGYIAQDDYPNSGLSTSTLTYSDSSGEKVFKSEKHFLNRTKQNNDIRTQLRAYLAELQNKKTNLQSQLIP